MKVFSNLGYFLLDWKNLFNLEGNQAIMFKLKTYLTTGLITLAFALPASASPKHTDYKGEMAPVAAAPASWLYMGAYGGYGDINGAYHQDGQFTQGRLAIGVHTPNYYRVLSVGAETGVQWGNDMRLEADETLVDQAGGLPIQTTLKPLVDLLLTMRIQFGADSAWFAVFKGGVAYRQLQFIDRSSSDDHLRKVNGEFQAGLGYNLTDHATITAFYQGIYSGNNAGVTLDADQFVHLNRIPTQQAGFLGLEYNV